LTRKRAIHVTGRDLILAVAENMRSSLEPLGTRTIAPSLYQVDLHAADYERLRPLFGELAAETKLTLERELVRLNRRASAADRLLAPFRSKRSKGRGQDGNGSESATAAGGMKGRAAPRVVSAAGRWFVHFQQDHKGALEPGDVQVASEFVLARGAFSAVDFSNLGSTHGVAHLDTEDMLARMNSAIEEAAFVAEYHADDIVEYAVEKNQQAQPGLESRLIDVVPATVLDRLREVDFVPITILDQVLRSPESMRALSARDFERFIATLIDRLGFQDVIITPRSGDQGRDVLATMIMHGIPMLFAFECKQYHPSNPVGPEVLRALLGTITHGPTKANKGVLVTTSTFTSGARSFILTEPSLDGKDFDGITSWMKEYARQRRRRA